MCSDTLTKLKLVLYFSQNMLFFVVVVNVYLVQRKKKHYNFSEFIVIEIVFLCLVAWRNSH